MAVKNLFFKVFLLVDNTPCYARVLEVAYPHVEVIFLPPNTTILIQPLNQGVILKFEKYVTLRAVNHILHAMKSDPKLTVGKYWKDLNIGHCISAIKDPLDDVKVFTINA